MPKLATEQRFWQSFRRNDNGCWLWTRSKTKQGYGTLHIGKDWIDNRIKRTAQAHRFSYELKYGAVPNGLQLDHLCRIRNCVNPDHLEAVTQQENMARGEVGARGRATHCQKGHPYDIPNTYHRKDIKARRCRECQSRAQRESRRRRRTSHAA